jgi:hypothetical protein
VGYNSFGPPGIKLVSTSTPAPSPPPGPPPSLLYVLQGGASSTRSFSSTHHTCVGAAFVAPHIPGLLSHHTSQDYCRTTHSRTVLDLVSTGRHGTKKSFACDESEPGVGTDDLVTYDVASDLRLANQSQCELAVVGWYLRRGGGGGGGGGVGVHVELYTRVICITQAVRGGGHACAFSHHNQ